MNTLPASFAPPADSHNDVPASLMELAVLALWHGFDHVSLGLGGLTYEEPFGSEWILHLTRRASFSTDEPHERLMITAGRRTDDFRWVDEDGHEQLDPGNAGAPTAYIGDRWGQRESPYLSAAEIRTWIETPSPLATPATDAELQRTRDQIERFMTASYAGWDVKVETGRHLALTFGHRGRVLSRAEQQAAQATMTVSVEISAVNTFYNLEGHPQHRDNGTELSDRHSLVDATALGRGVDVILGIEDHRVMRGNVEDFDALARARAPWFVGVAEYDNQNENWITPDAAKPENWRAEK